MILSSLLVMGLASGCVPGFFSNDSSSGFDDLEKQFIKELFEGPYLWYEHANTSIDPAPYTTPQALIDAYKYTELDHWSFALTEKEFNNFVNQKSGGFGIGLTADFRVRFVRIDAPAWGKIERGDTLLTINGKAAAPALLHAAAASGSPGTFVLKRGDNNITVTVTPRDYTYHVTLGHIFHRGDHTIGYLRYDSFTDSSDKELAERFKAFHAAGIDELIIDLRYNGGGVVDRAVDLMGYINHDHPGETAVHLAWNDQYRSQDTTYKLPSSPVLDSLGLSRIFFLVTHNSASASELVINGLIPYLGNTNVITIGTATHGKNVGMVGVEHGGYYYFLINFYVKNADDTISPATGIPPTCSARDDLAHRLGDANETMLKAALYYIEHDDCPPSPLSRHVGSRSLTAPLLIDGQEIFDGLIAP